MKKIRIDYYNYRLKKGRAEILLEKEEGTDEYFLPFHYVRAEENLGKNGLIFCTEDDGDLVINQTYLNKCTRRKKDKGWTPLDKLRELSIRRDEYFHICHNIYTFFLSVCPCEGESGIRNRVSAMLESVKVDRAKKEYIETIRHITKGYFRDALTLYEEGPDPELVQRELDTLEHFRIRKPNPIPMCQLDGYLLDNDLYTFECIDWEALGAKRRPRRNPLGAD